MAVILRQCGHAIHPPMALSKSVIHNMVRQWFVRKQEGRCAICYRTFDLVGTPHLDHCHESDAIRGALCRGCNAGLGHFRDNPDSLAAAIEYLQTDFSDNPPYPECDPGFDYVEWLDTKAGHPSRGRIAQKDRRQ